jgi:hypothetical protein
MPFALAVGLALLGGLTYVVSPLLITWGFIATNGAARFSQSRV